MQDRHKTIWSVWKKDCFSLSLLILFSSLQGGVRLRNSVQVTIAGQRGGAGEVSAEKMFWDCCCFCCLFRERFWWGNGKLRLLTWCSDLGGDQSWGWYLRRGDTRGRSGDLGSKKGFARVRQQREAGPGLWYQTCFAINGVKELKWRGLNKRTK